MKSTPIMKLETITGLQSVDDRRDLKLLSQAAKFKRLQDHPMRQRLSQPTKGRLKRESFIHQSRILERRQEDILDHDPKDIPPCLAVPAWSESTSPIIRCTIPCVGQKDSQSGPERKSLTQEYLETDYPKESWTHGYTDVSAKNAVRNGGVGVYIHYEGGTEDKISLATGLYSTNCKAEAEALKTAAAHIEVSTHASPSGVLLTDTLSALQALQTNRDTELNELSAALALLCRGHAVTLQWIPSHCNVHGNEAADSLTKEGTTKEQVDRSSSYPEVKTILKAKQHSKWRHKHPRYNKADPYYLLTRREQVTVFRLWTGHNRLNYHLYSKLRIGHTEQCSCGTGSQTTEHLLQSCPIYEPLRKEIWPDHTPVDRKLYGSLRDLRCTATFTEETGVSIWRTIRRRCLLWQLSSSGAPSRTWTAELPTPASCLKVSRWRLESGRGGCFHLEESAWKPNSASSTPMWSQSCFTDVRHGGQHRRCNERSRHSSTPVWGASTKSNGKRRSEMKICGSERDRNQWPSRYCGGSGTGSDALSGSQHPAPYAKPWPGTRRGREREAVLATVGGETLKQSWNSRGPTGPEWQNSPEQSAMAGGRWWPMLYLERWA